jgi:hypothetical protein
MQTTKQLIAEHSSLLGLVLAIDRSFLAYRNYPVSQVNKERLVHSKRRACERLDELECEITRRLAS